MEVKSVSGWCWCWSPDFVGKTYNDPESAFPVCGAAHQAIWGSWSSSPNVFGERKPGWLLGLRQADLQNFNILQQKVALVDWDAVLIVLGGVK
jgi:hypothetical protein